MKLSWNRKTFILTFVMVVIVVGTLVYGQVYFLSPIIEQSQKTTQIVDEQKALMASYPPDKALLDEYREKYQETGDYLPEGERVNLELVELEKAATEELVRLTLISRVDEPQAIEGLDEGYKKSTYQVEMVSDSAENMHKLIEKLTAFERVWNIYSFGFEKSGEGPFNGTFTFELFYHDEITE